MSNQPAEREYPVSSRQLPSSYREAFGHFPLRYIHSQIREAGGAQLVQTIEQIDHHNTAVHAHDLTVALETVEPGVVVVRASGELDVRSADALRQCLDTAVRNSTCLVVDFTEVTFLATAGLTCLIELSEATAQAKLPWALATDVRPVLRALELTGCLDRMTVRPTRDAATRAALATSE